MEDNKMENIVVEKFNKGSLNVWFYIDNIRYYESNQVIVEKKDEFLCYFKFSEPTIICLGELVKHPDGKIVIFKTAQNALVASLNYVKQKFNLQD
jgi:hypothetical protein